MEDVKIRIIEASIKLYVKHGIRAVTMNDISQHCGISKRTLYEHVADKEQLLTICVQMMNAESIRERNALKAQSSNVLEYFMLTAQHLADLSIRINPNFFRELDKFHPKVAKIQEEYTQSIVLPDFIRLIQKGVEEGVFIDRPSITLSAMLFFGQVQYLVHSDFVEKLGFSVHEVLQNALYTFSRGIASQKGLDIIEKMTPN